MSTANSPQAGVGGSPATAIVTTAPAGCPAASRAPPGSEDRAAAPRDTPPLPSSYPRASGGYCRGTRTPHGPPPLTADVSPRAARPRCREPPSCAGTTRANPGADAATLGETRTGQTPGRTTSGVPHATLGMAHSTPGMTHSTCGSGRPKRRVTPATRGSRLPTRRRAYSKRRPRQTTRGPRHSTRRAGHSKRRAGHPRRGPGYSKRGARYSAGLLDAHRTQDQRLAGHATAA